MVKKKSGEYEESQLAKKVKTKVSSYEGKVNSTISKGIQSIDQHIQSANTWLNENKGKVIAGSFLAGMLIGFKVKRRK